MQMAAQRILIIGGVAAGPKVAARARRLLPDAEITVIDKGRYISYAGCGMPFYIDDQVGHFRELFSTGYGLPRDAEYFRSERGINFRTRTEALFIDRARKEVLVRDLETGRQSRLGYDQLVLTIGAESVMPRIEGTDFAGVFKFRDPGDAQTVKEYLEKRDVQEVVVVGAGFIGIELAGALANLKLLTTVIEFQEQILPLTLDPDMARLLEQRLAAAHGIEFRTGERVIRLEGDEQGRVCRVVTDRGGYDAELVIMAVGVRPNVGLAREAGLAIGETGAILIDEYCRTSDPDIYACGDCVETTHRLTGQKVYAPFASAANRQGRVVADNLAGRRSVYRGVLGTAVLQAGSFNAGRTGLTEEQARRLGYEVVTSIVPQRDRTHYHPGSGMVILKIIADRASGRLLGVQGIGPGEVVKRIDVAAAVLHFGGMVNDLIEMDLGYAPPFNMPIDPLQHAANALVNKLDGIVETISADELKAKLDADEDFVLLDVRLEKETRHRKIDDPRRILVTLGELRRRVHEIPRDKEIITICDIGVRSYEAYRLLRGAGFAKVKSVEGGMRTWPYGPASMF
jgi:NADPH-dependent 2,4-dienoyl-CoA reductase/sulfur reductase-like enzyme/rhodanese-related sulfurtransferase